jgi:hypothetical protein
MMHLRSLARNLVDAFAKVPDPRHGPRRQYPLRSVLALTALAALDGVLNAPDITRWAKQLPDGVVSELGFPGEQLPRHDTLRGIVGQVDRAAVREALECWRCRCDEYLEWDRVGALRIASEEEPSRSILFDCGAPMDPGRSMLPAVLDQPKMTAAKVPPLRRWKRTRADLHFSL